jgi:predicted N-acetyltransferase YhbS
MRQDVLERVRLREARPEDDAAAGALLVEAFLTQYARHLPEVAATYSEERKRELRDVASRRATGTVLVAELDGRVVGTVTLVAPGAAHSRAWVPGAVEIRALATAVDLHGVGLAGPLMAEAERLARQWGAPALCLHVRKGVAGVGRLYERRGFLREPAGDLELPTVSLQAYLLRL